MPNESLEDALKEVYALAPNDEVVLDTLEISYVGLTETLYLVKDRVEWDLTLEDLSTQTFKPCGFRFIQPAAGKDGVQQLSLAIDNVGSEVPDFFEALGTELTEPVKVTYRPYLSSDTTQPQMDPPLVLFLVDINMTAFEVTARATFSSVVNTKYPTQYYSAQRFPGLVGRGGNVITPPAPSDAWDLSKLAFSASFDVGTIPAKGIYFKDDGTRMYVVLSTGDENSNRVAQYDLSTAWDITTASSAGEFLVNFLTGQGFAPDEANIFGIFFKPDGTEMFISGYNARNIGIGQFSDEYVINYTLSTAWDITTASLTSSKIIQGSNRQAFGLHFRSDGSEYYIIGVLPGLIRYGMSTDWDVTTASETGSLSITGEDNVSKSMFFKTDDGEKFYTNGHQNDSMYQYGMSILFDITTGVYDSVSFNYSVSDPNGLYWRSDGLRTYTTVLQGGRQYVYQYDII